MPVRSLPGIAFGSRMSGRLVSGWIATVLLAALIGAPLALVAWLSLRDPAGQGVNGLAWLTLAASSEANLALGYSIAMGAAIALVSSICSLPLAYQIGVRGGIVARVILALLLILWLLDPGMRILGWMQIMKSGTLLGLLPDYVQGSYIAELAAGIHAWLPMAAILQAFSFARVPSTLLTTARECGASPLTILNRILWPRSRRWFAFSASLIFCGAVGGFLEPRLLGSSLFEQATEWLQRAMEREVGWPYASTMLLALLIVAVVPPLLMLGGRRRA